MKRLKELHSQSQHKLNLIQNALKHDNKPRILELIEQKRVINLKISQQITEDRKLVEKAERVLRRYNVF